MTIDPGFDEPGKEEDRTSMQTCTVGRPRAVAMTLYRYPIDDDHI